MNLYARSTTRLISNISSSSALKNPQSDIHPLPNLCHLCRSCAIRGKKIRIRSHHAVPCHADQVWVGRGGCGLCLESDSTFPASLDVVSIAKSSSILAYPVTVGKGPHPWRDLKTNTYEYINGTTNHILKVCNPCGLKQKRILYYKTFLQITW